MVEARTRESLSGPLILHTQPQAQLDLLQDMILEFVCFYKHFKPITVRVAVGKFFLPTDLS